MFDILTNTKTYRVPACNISHVVTVANTSWRNSEARTKALYE